MDVRLDCDESCSFSSVMFCNVLYSAQVPFLIPQTKGNNVSKQEISGTEKGLRSCTNTRDYKMGSCLEIDRIVILVGSPIPNRSKGRNQR